MGTNKKSKKNKKRRQMRVLFSILAVVIVLAGAGAVFIFYDHVVKSPEGSKQVEDSGKGYRELKEGEDPSDVEVSVKASEDYVEPGKDTLDIDKILGFEAQPGSQTISADGEADGQEGAKETPAVTISDPNLTVESVGRYSGSFLEDGSDEPTANVAAMLITNHSDKMLQIAQIDFQVNDTETASFKVTDLPAGTSTLVMEANKREYKEEDSYTYGNAATGYMEAPTLEEDIFDLTTEKGKITLKNKTDKTYKKVYVYYKYVQIGGAYLGGITYRTPFENVGGGAEVEAIAGHFNPDSSKIMAVQILDE